MNKQTTRSAKIAGELVTWHMFYVNDKGDPMALVETDSGLIREVYATLVEFSSTTVLVQTKDAVIENSYGIFFQIDDTMLNELGKCKTDIAVSYNGVIKEYTFNEFLTLCGFGSLNSLDS